MSDKKQPETEQPRQQNKGWSWGKWIIMIVLGGFSLFICWLYLSPEQRATNNHIWLQLYLGALAVAGGLVLCKPQIITSNPKKYFITSVLVTGITGGVFALLLPIAVKSTTTGVGGLRHSILLATGGLLAILTLGETRRKNDNDLKAANELQIRHEETLGQQKEQFEEQLGKQQEQFDANAFKERKAERRERYTKAVEQLGSKEASVRMGGVYTLVGLVDEWLEEESIEKYEDRLKEGQVIINNLCAYIRSPFTLASHYDELSQDTPTTEVIYKDIQQKSHKKWQIISNNLYACIRSRFTPDSRHDELSQDSYIAFYKDKEQEFYADKANLKSEADVRLSIIKEIHDRLQGPEENTPGIWSDFEYNFSRSIFFYPVDFRNSKYNKPVNFSGSIYYEEVSFSNSDYYNTANLYGLTCHKSASFNDSIYYGDAYLGGKFKIQSDFSKSTYHKNITFSGYYKNTADFRESIYCNEVSFRGIHEMEADFTDSIYHKAVFNIKCYEESKFIGSIFSEELSTVYSEGYQEFPSSFINEPPQFYNNKKFTLFGSPNNDFHVNNHRNKINIEKNRNIPLNCNTLNQCQKEYLRDTFEYIKNIKYKLLEAKDPKEKVEISKKLRSFAEELHEWREEATTVKVEDVTAEDTES